MNKNSMFNRYATTLTVLCLPIMLLTGCQGILGEKSANPGINAHYKKNPEAETWIPRFERESREIFNVRYEILSAMNIKPGMSVADVGAGTGLFTGMLAEKVGPTGKVYAVDVVPKFLSYIDKRTAKDGYKNVTTVLCAEDSVSLPEASVDVMFICDTYHHFEYPTRSLQSIWKAMRPGGIVFVVDFHRIPGVSLDWICKHVRGSLEDFRAEFEAEGFEFAGQVEIEGLNDNYAVRYRRP